MKFHLPSFLIGYAAGGATALFARHLRPLLVEAATTVYRVADSAVTRLAVRREELADLLAESRARARGTIAFVEKPQGA